jgi:hypothetical protein
MEVGYATTILPPLKMPGTHWTGGWVGPKANMDVSLFTNAYTKQGKWTFPKGLHNFCSITERNIIEMNL